MVNAFNRRLVSSLMGKDSNRKWVGNKPRGAGNFSRLLNDGGKKGIGHKSPQRPYSKEKDKKDHCQKVHLADETTESEATCESKLITDTDGNCSASEKEGVIKMVDNSGRVTPEFAQIISAMTMKDIVVLLMNIQKLMAQSPVAARKALSECPALCRALLHAQIVTGVMNEQFRCFTALTSDSRELLDEMRAARISQERATCNDVMDAFLSAPMECYDKAPVSAPPHFNHGLSQVHFYYDNYHKYRNFALHHLFTILIGITRNFRELREVKDTNDKRKSLSSLANSQLSSSDKPASIITTLTDKQSDALQDVDEGVLKLAEEVVNHGAMLNKILTTPLEDIANFPDSQRRQVLQLRQILAARGYAVHD